MKWYNTLMVSLLLSAFGFTACGKKSSATEEKAQTDCEKAGYKGKVKEVRMSRYFAPTEDEEDWYTTLGPVVTIFNEDGSLKEEKSYSNLDVVMYGDSLEYKDGKLVRKVSLSESLDPEETLYAYDNAGNLIEKKTITREMPEEEGRVTEHILYSYDGENRLIKKSSIVYEGYEDPYATEIRYTYDAAGRKIEEHIRYALSESKPSTDVITWKYDAKGQLSERFYKTERSEEFGNTLDRYEYDEHGNMTKSVCFSDGKELYSYTYSYVYKNGRIIEKTQQTSEGSKIVSSYDENGNPVWEQTYGLDGVLLSRIEYVCDAKGNIIKSSLFSLDDRGVLCETTREEWIISYYE